MRPCPRCSREVSLAHACRWKVACPPCLPCLECTCPLPTNSSASEQGGAGSIKEGGLLPTLPNALGKEYRPTPLRFRQIIIARRAGLVPCPRTYRIEGVVPLKWEGCVPPFGGLLALEDTATRLTWGGWNVEDTATRLLAWGAWNGWKILLFAFWLPHGANQEGSRHVAARFQLIQRPAKQQPRRPHRFAFFFLVHHAAHDHAGFCPHTSFRIRWENLQIATWCTYYSTSGYGNRGSPGVCDTTHSI